MKAQRFDTLDALRGLAMLWMTVFHLCFDLSHAGLMHQDFYHDPVWTWQRVMIVSLFLFCAGLGQAVATAQGQSWSRFWKRWVQVAGCAALVTLASWWMFPQSFIYFGILHGMAAMLILVRLTAHWGRWLWLVGGLAVASKFMASYALSTWASGSFINVMNAPTLNWLGWITQLPITEDYAPVFPWLGVMWWGAAAGAWLMPSWMSHSGSGGLNLLPRAGRALATLGRWSLSYYMLHQPVLIGLVSGLVWLKG
jgi:uncharacterized membrane protein